GHGASTKLSVSGSRSRRIGNPPREGVMTHAVRLVAVVPVAPRFARALQNRNVPRTFTILERVAGIEPGRSAWEADRLPLQHTRVPTAWHGSAKARCALPHRAQHRTPADLVNLVAMVNGCF